MNNEEFRHWSEEIAQTAFDKFGEKQIVAAGWTPSGVYHIGNSREAVTCNAINISLREMGADSQFIFIIDDFDPLDKIPSDLGEYTTDLRPYLGHPLTEVPDFTETYENYAAYFTAQAKKAMEDFNFDVKFVYASEHYAEGKYDKYLQIYYDNQNRLDDLFQDITGSALDSYISIICQNCGNAKTPVIQEVNGKNVTYSCISDRMYRGCDFEGEINLDDHQWKLRWRLDFPARQQFLGVTVEPSGKDHSVAGGSVDTAKAIHENIFDQKPPLLEKYGFITLKGKKFSGSKGGALPASEVANIMPVSAYLFLIYRSDLVRDINFNPESMEYADLLDEFDDARAMAQGVEFEGRERERDKLITAVQLAMQEEEKGFIPSQMSFSELALVYQTSLFDKEATVEKLDQMEKFPSEDSKRETKKRLELLDNWLEDMAPDNIKFELLETPPDDLQEIWTEDVLDTWITSVKAITNQTNADDFTEKLRDEGEKRNLSPKEFYQPFYYLLTGKTRGPNASNLVMALGKSELLERFDQIREEVDS